jgi:hypothetical protein
MSELLRLRRGDLLEHPLSNVPVPSDEVADAGVDPRPPATVRQGLRTRLRARREFGEAVRLAESDAETAHHAIREAVLHAANASYYLEGTEAFQAVHADLHEMGRFARERFPAGCHLEWVGNRYEHRCPVALAHKRMGFSPGMIVRRRICSLCSVEVSECPHFPDHWYRVRGGTEASPTGRCRVCASEKCDHDPDSTYMTNPIRIVEEIERVEEVSLVRSPRQPLARPIGIPIDTEDLRKVLGPEFTPGVRVDCSRCIQACPGFTYLTAPS